MTDKASRSGDIIYLDSASTSLLRPSCIAAAVCESLGSFGSDSRGTHGAALLASRTIFQARQKISGMFGLNDPARVVFTSGATESLNIAISGLLRPGSHAVSTVLEHNSVLRPLYRQESEGATLSLAGCDAKGRISPSEIEALIRPETVLVACTHVSNVTGNRNDIEAIGEVCRRKGVLFLVDAAQSAGFFPIDMQDMKIDLLCFSGHKGLMAPQGVGCLLVREGIDIPPFKVGGTGVQSSSRSQPAEMPTPLEAGTLNGHGIAGLYAALQYIEDTGIGTIREMAAGLAGRFLQGAAPIKGVTVYGDMDQTDRAPIVSLNLAGSDSAEISDILEQRYGIYTRAGAHCAPLLHNSLGTRDRGAVRFSFSHLNTAEETDTAIAAIRELAGESS
jgi:cysteine desulfurase family protein